MIDDALLHKWIEGKLTPEELKEFKSRPEYNSLSKLYQHTEDMQAPDLDEDQMLKAILSQPKKEVKSTVENQQEQKVPQASRRVFMANWMKVVAAASVALLLGFFFWPKSSGTIVELVATNEEKVDATLPDGSRFTLEKDSRLTYDKNDWNNNREVKLAGEAFFEVEKGAKFKINTANGIVQVLGTSFDVSSRHQVLEVKCKTGKVAVLKTSGEQITVLHPGHSVHIEQGKETMFSFKKVSLADVIKEVERQFSVKIDIGNINVTEKVTCNFQNKDLGIALKTTLAQSNIKYDINGKTVKLSN